MVSFLHILYQIHKKLLSIASVGYFIVYLLFFFLGIYGTYIGIEKLINGTNIKDIVFMDKGFYVFSPFYLLVLLSIL